MIGDVASIVDINALHHIAGDDSDQLLDRLNIVVVNNNGCGIFSFLPI